MKTTTKPDFHMTHSETKSRAVSLSNHSKENEEDSSQTWIIKLSTKSSNSQKRERDYIPTEKNKVFMAAINFPSPSSCLQLALFQSCYLASPLKPTNLLPKYLTPLAKTPPWTSPPFQQNFSCSSLTASMPNERSSIYSSKCPSLIRSSIPLLWFSCSHPRADKWSLKVPPRGKLGSCKNDPKWGSTNILNKYIIKFMIF